MTPWTLAMLALLPLLFWRWESAKARTWAVLIGASFATLISDHPVWYLAIDSIAGMLVVAHPRGAAQKLIGGIFILMIGSDLGFWGATLTHTELDRTGFLEMLTHMGWAQWAILAWWCGYDVVRGYFADRDYGPDRVYRAVHRAGDR